MNPLKWKREHRLALILACAVGALLGLGLGFREVHRNSTPYGWRTAETYWLLIAIWTLCGAALGGGIVYIRQLLRH